MQTQAVKKYVAFRLKRLSAQGEHPQKASLANLRRGVGKAPGELPALWGAFLEEIPEEMQSKTGQPTRAEWAIYLALTMYALHQQGHSLPQDDMNREGIPLGRAVCRLAESDEREKDNKAEDSSALKRFNRLATAADMPELAHHLRGIVQLLRAEGIPLDYPQLAADLYLLQFPEYAPHVKLRWGQDFYYMPKADEAENDQ